MALVARLFGMPASVIPRSLPRLRDEYGFRWSSLHELALPLAAQSVRLATAPILAAASRTAPQPRELAA
jgi:hypothetical protein